MAKSGIIKATRGFARAALLRLPFGCAADFDGFHISGSLRHRRYLRGFFRPKWKEAYMSELFCAAVRPGMVVADVGAHCGWYTLLAARAVGPTGSVYAFEPDPRTFPYLQKNVRDNGFSERVIALPTALSDTRSRSELRLHPTDISRTSLFGSDGASCPIDTAPLDELLGSDVLVDVMKVDIEGAELRALAGMRDVLLRSRRQLKLFIECNPDALSSAGTSGEVLLETLGKLDFRISMIDERNRGLVDLANEEPLRPAIRGCVNLYCTPRETTL